MSSLEGNIVHDIERNEQIGQSILENDVVALRQALENAQPNGFINACVMHVAEIGRIDLLKEFIAFGMPTRTYNKALEKAAQTNQLECVQLLATVADFQSMDMEPLSGAASEGHVRVVEFLLPLTYQEDKNHALIFAAKNQHVQCVTILSASANATYIGSKALQWACFNKNHDMIDVLYDLSDPQQALAVLMDQKNTEGADILKQHISLKQKNIIEEHMPDKPSRLNKKM